MNDKEKTEEVVRLLALKAYERPCEERVEKNVQNVMRAVRKSNARPSLHLFPDKSFGWMIAQPRYGIAALFVLFLGLHLLQNPFPQEAADEAVALEEPVAVGADFLAVAETNPPVMHVPALPRMTPAVRPDYSSLIQPVSYTP